MHDATFLMLRIIFTVARMLVARIHPPTLVVLCKTWVKFHLLIISLNDIFIRINRVG
jgi:hypothetical protein